MISRKPKSTELNAMMAYCQDFVNRILQTFYMRYKNKEAFRTSLQRTLIYDVTTKICFSPNMTWVTIMKNSVNVWKI